MSKRPKIAVTLDWQEEGTFSSRPHYALREHYFNIIYMAGGVPFGVPYIEGGVNEYLQMADGVVVPGGFFASPSDWYVEPDAASPYEESPRLQFDLDIIKGALELDKPILGVCAGMQLMGGLLGCKMTHNVQEYVQTDIDHLNEKPAEEKAHLVHVQQGTLLDSIVGQKNIDVNTAHKEAIVQVAADVMVNAISEDKVIEGIEIEGKRFALGVQWHPEFFAEKDDPSFKLFEALVAEAGK